MLKWSLAIAATLAIGNAAWAAENQRPNVLFMIVDDLNGWIGCLDPRLGAQTPQIDRLASRGTLFGNAHCAAPVCNPSRTALLTGLRPSTTGIYDNLQAGSPPDHPVMRGAVATLFQRPWLRGDGRRQGPRSLDRTLPLGRIVRSSGANGSCETAAEQPRQV